MSKMESVFCHRLRVNQNFEALARTKSGQAGQMSLPGFCLYEIQKNIYHIQAMIIECYKAVCLNSGTE